MKSCTSEELKKALELSPKNTCFIDVRTPGEYEKGHIENFINIPLGSDPEEFEKYKDRTAYVLCLSGGRSQVVCELLEKLSFHEVIDVEGGILTWRAKRYPTKE